MQQIAYGSLTLLWILMFACGNAHAQAKASQNKPATNTSSSRTNRPKRPESPPRYTEENKRIVDRIVIKGNRKIEAEAIRSKLTSREGLEFSEEKIRKDIEEIFNTGFFNDIQVERTDTSELILTFTVLEKPSVVEINYEGNEEIEDSDLKEATGFKPFEILSMAKLRESAEKIEKLYEDKGFFLARVNPRVEPTEDPDQVKVLFDIKENDKVRVRRISFIGNKALSAEKLKGVMLTKESGFFSFVSGSGAYKQEAFDRDIQVLQLLYFNEGYVKVKVDRPQVYVTPDKRSIFISVRIEEGDQYRVGTVDFTGDILFSREELFESIQIDEKEVFSYQTLQEDLKSLQAKYGDLGYAYANPIPRTITRDAEKEVDITFEIDKGSKVYIGRINTIGNTKTRDKVIRREMRIVEGELYNETRRRESEANIRRLGFFEEVNFNTKAPRGRPDLMDIDIVVKERNTGTIQIGAGYSNFNGFVLNGQVNQLNFMGRGQRLGVSIDFSRITSLYRLNFTEPFFRDTEWSVGGDIFRSQRLLQDFEEVKTGGSFRVGHPLAPYLFGFIRYRLDETEVKLVEETGDPDLFPVQTTNGTTSSVTFSLEYDKRDDRMMPSKGLFSSLSLEYAGLGGSLNYTKGLGVVRFYQNLFWDVIWRNNINYGFISSNVEGRPPPFNELFLLGGANSLRGFNWFTIGRRKFSQRRLDQLNSSNPGLSTDEKYRQSLAPFGGTQQFFYNMEFQFPLIREAGINGVVFYDVGTAENEVILNDFRQNVGFGFRWFSPIGPLRFEWGFPLQIKREYNESPVNFEFAIGAPF